MTMKPKFISSTDSNEKSTMYYLSPRSIVQKLFDSLLHKYHEE